LGAGLIPFAASMMMPNWLSLVLPSSAAAASGCVVPSGDMIPFVTLNLAGGAGLVGNYIVQDKGMQMLPSYNLMGLGNVPPVAMEFGNVPFAGVSNGQLVSQFLQGLRETAPTSLAKTAFVAVCVRSRDDSAENKFSADGMLAKAGLMGSILPNLGRRANTASGIGQVPAVLNPPSPLVISSFTSLTNSLGYAGALGNTMNASQKQSLARLVSRLSESQSRKLASVSRGDEIKSIVDCAGIKNQDLVQQGANAVDPRQDAQFSTSLSGVWGINAGTNANNRELIFGSMVYNALKSQSGSVALEIGGFDYHDNTRTTGNTRDLDAGRTAGRILESAQAMNRPVCLYITSDGATSSAKSDSVTAPWTSDRGTAGLSFFMYFNPAGRPQTSGFQIGNFTSGQVADETSPVGSSPEAAAAAVFANYLAINKRLDLFNGIAGRVLDANALNAVLKFA